MTYFFDEELYPEVDHTQPNSIDEYLDAWFDS